MILETTYHKFTQQVCILNHLSKCHWVKCEVLVQTIFLSDTLTNYHHISSEREQSLLLFIYEPFTHRFLFHVCLAFEIFPTRGIDEAFFLCGIVKQRQQTRVIVGAKCVMLCLLCLESVLVET